MNARANKGCIMNTRRYISYEYRLKGKDKKIIIKKE
jgi:hypothetical protein